MSTSTSGSTLRAATVVGALGIVYGDIGTSPLYALEEAVRATQLPSNSPVAVYGVLSLIFWALAVLVTVKYVLLMLRADNEGEGGILALLALVQRALSGAHVWKRHLITLALIGTALFYCDSLITPAMSVLSAVEGMELLSPSFARGVIPLTLLILAALFLMQRRGTDVVGKLFGPVMLLWFAVLTLTGAVAIARNPAVLAAVNPLFAVALFSHAPALALAIMGAVFLAVTGGEALYADMGHFGRVPVRVAWLGMVWPALLINYFGQGAWLLQAPAGALRPFYQLVPVAWLPAMVVLATAATVIASQAVISGAFSITRQAVQLDLLPRTRILQTSAHEHGQIYVPMINALMWFLVSVFVVTFGSSTALAGAYGASVVGTMLITTILGSVIAATQWRWPLAVVALVFIPLLLVDLTFAAGNMTKLPQGGWVPILLAAIVFGFFTTWRNGRILLRAALRKQAVPRAKLASVLEGVHRVAGTGVFLVSDPDTTPSALIRNLEHNKIAHETLVILYIEFQRAPRQNPADRVRIEALLPGVYFVRTRFGFMETPDVAESLRACKTKGLRIALDECSFFLGWHLVRAHPRAGWGGLQRRLFEWMQRRSTQAAEFFRMPTRGVVVLATDVEI